MRKSIFVIALAALFASCANTAKKESVVKPEMTDVKGDLKGCYEVVEKDYKIREDGINLVINVELKRTSKELPFDASVGEFSYGRLDDGNGKEVKVGFGIELLDGNNDVIESIKAGESGWYGVETDNIPELMKLSENETGTLSIKVKGENNPVKFRILTNVKESTYEPSESNSIVSSNESSESSKEVSSDSSNDWDNVLNEYEKYIDKYIKFYKKAKNGDTSALTEYPALLEKAQSISNKLGNAQGNLKPAQASRFLKLQQKLTNAALE